MSTQEFLTTFVSGFSQLPFQWFMVLLLLLVWGVIETFFFALYVPIYYKNAIPIRKITLETQLTGEEAKARIREIFKKHRVGYREDQVGWLFRFPNVPIAQVFVTFGFIEWRVRRAGMDLVIEAKTYLAMPVIIAVLAFAGILDSLLRGQFSGALNLAFVLFFIAMPMTCLPIILWQRKTFGKLTCLIEREL